MASGLKRIHRFLDCLPFWIPMLCLIIVMTMRIFKFFRVARQDAADQNNSISPSSPFPLNGKNQEQVTVNRAPSPPGSKCR